MPIALPLQLQVDPKQRRKAVVQDANGASIGMISHDDQGWRNWHPQGGKNLRPVPIGPFPSLEAAFQAFRGAFGDV